MLFSEFTMGGSETWKTVTSPNSSFTSWLDEKSESVPKIATNNAKETESIYSNLLERIKHKASVSNQRIDKDRVTLTDIKSQIENTCSEEEIFNNNLNYQEIVTQIQDRRKRLHDLENEVKLLKTKIHTSIQNCNSRIAAHRKAIQCYECFFNVKITLRASKDDQIVMHVVFENMQQHRITIIFDQNYNAKSFEINSLHADEYTKLTDWFNTAHPNPTNLIIKLREYVISLK